jgi:histidine ammonia-lyase
VIYGVTTGFGDSCTVAIQPELIAELPRHLYIFHGCGLGGHFSPSETRAVIATRLTSLCKGFSGVSVGLLEQLTGLLAQDILPAIPSEGSVGASGDLTPLSYLAAVLCGEGEVLRAGTTIPAAAVLADAGITPLRLRPKEALAIMNGTAVMTGLACLNYVRAEYLTRLTTRITALASFALDGNAEHFDETLFSVKPHPGQQAVAGWLRQDLPVQQSAANGKRLQDRYSIRCAPHVIGVLADALSWLRSYIENELNSANDNPIIDATGERVLHGGHFYGGHIAFAMDSMKNAVANLADLLDRQMALLVDSRYSNGLPANLSGVTGPRAAINHGLKALQISVSAWTAEALKLTMPASVFSRSTECHNQDKVSMGTIAARDCTRVLELTEQVAAGLLITVRQAVRLRCGLNPALAPSPSLQAMIDALSRDIAAVEEDRRLEPDLRLLLEQMRSRAWKIYE